MSDFVTKRAKTKGAQGNFQGLREGKSLIVKAVAVLIEVTLNHQRPH